MDQAWDRAHGPRPNPATVRVRELSWPGLHNPRPQSKDPGSHRDSHGERLVEEYLSPARLVSARGLRAQATGVRIGHHCRADVQPALCPQPSWPCLVDGRSRPCCAPSTCPTLRANPRCLVIQIPPGTQHTKGTSQAGISQVFAE